MKWVLALMKQSEQLQSQATMLGGAWTRHLTFLQWHPPLCTTVSESIPNDSSVSEVLQKDDCLVPVNTEHNLITDFLKMESVYVQKYSMVQNF